MCVICFTGTVVVGGIYENVLTVKQFGRQPIGPAATLDSSFIHTGDKGTGRSFAISVARTDDYHVGCLLLGMVGRRYNCYLDGQVILEGVVNPEADGWQSIPVTDPSTGLVRKLHLTQGNHLITFTGSVSFAPEVYGVKVGAAEEDVVFSEARDLAQQVSTLLAKVITPQNSAAAAAAAQTPATPPDPLAEYVYYQDIPFTYTYNAPIYLPVGTYTFETKKAPATAAAAG